VSAIGLTSLAHHKSRQFRLRDVYRVRSEHPDPDERLTESFSSIFIGDVSEPSNDSGWAVRTF